MPCSDVIYKTLPNSVIHKKYIFLNCHSTCKWLSLVELGGASHIRRLGAFCKAILKKIKRKKNGTLCDIGPVNERYCSSKLFKSIINFDFF